VQRLLGARLGHDLQPARQLQRRRAPRQPGPLEAPAAQRSRPAAGGRARRRRSRSTPGASAGHPRRSQGRRGHAPASRASAAAIDACPGPPKVPAPSAPCPPPTCRWKRSTIARLSRSASRASSSAACRPRCSEVRHASARSATSPHSSSHSAARWSEQARTGGGQGRASAPCRSGRPVAPTGTCCLPCCLPQG
jgi:hypothetical protein